MKICAICGERNADDRERCKSCGNDLPATVPAETPDPRASEPGDLGSVPLVGAEERREPPPPPPPPEVDSEPEPEPGGLDLSGGSERSDRPGGPGDDRWEGSREPIPPAEAESGEALPYDRIVAEVDRHLDRGYQLFVVVGHPGSGKTHALRALHLLLERQGFNLPEARADFREVHVPGTTGHTVKDYVCDGPNGEKWIFVDVGGELYTRLLENDWRSREEHSLQLTRRLRHARGLLFFLHLQREHLGQGPTELDPVLFDDDEARYDVLRERARERQRELDLFDHFLLFFRAILREDGDVAKVIELCRRAGSLEQGLRDYRAGAPLDVPAMFFFTQADKYAADDFEIGGGRHVAPRALDLPVAAFAARHVPYLFFSLLRQVRRFKFDFLQSYEESDSGKLDEDGQRRMATHWQTDDDEPLSVGLFAGLEFLLRNHPSARGWRGPGIDSRTALWLHRKLHPGAWRGVKGDLGKALRRGGGIGR